MFPKFGAKKTNSPPPKEETEQKQNTNKVCTVYLFWAVFRPKILETDTDLGRNILIDFIVE